MPETGSYLYAVTRPLAPDALPECAGVGGTGPRVVCEGGLAAVVGTVDLAEFGEEELRRNLEDLEWLEATVRAHHGVVDRIAGSAPVAPVRIATIYQDDDRVRRLLRERREEFAEALDRITGRVEVGVKAYARSAADRTDDPAPPGAGSEPRLTPDQPGAGAAYLRRRRAQRHGREEARRRLAEQARTAQEELAQRAVACREHAPQDPRLSGRAETMVLNVAYLLDRGRVPEFAIVAAELDARLPEISVEVTGPWPPYSFTAVGESA